MKRRLKKILLYIFVASFALLLGVVLSMDEPFIVRANVMDSIQQYDLGIDKVVMEKIADPNSDLNYYKYNATLILHNYGDDLMDRKIVLHAGENQKHVFVFNTDDGFSLKKGEKYIVRNYGVLTDNIVDNEEIAFEIDLRDRKDINSANNRYLLNFN